VNDHDASSCFTENPDDNALDIKFSHRMNIGIFWIFSFQKWDASPDEVSLQRAIAIDESRDYGSVMRILLLKDYRIPIQDVRSHHRITTHLERKGAGVRTNPDTGEINTDVTCSKFFPTGGPTGYNLSPNRDGRVKG
jgi:hypothetical protein